MSAGAARRLTPAHGAAYTTGPAEVPPAVWGKGAALIRSILRPAPQILVVLAFLVSCGSSTSTSCGCLGTSVPLAAPLDPAHTIQEGAQAYITPAGFSFLDSSVGTLIANFLPSGLTFQVPSISNTEYLCPTGGTCPFTSSNQSCQTCVFGVCTGSLCISEYSYDVCGISDCPFSGADCDGAGADPQGACPVTARIDSLSLDTVTPNVLDATITMDIDASEYGLNSSGVCTYGGSGAQCNNTIWISGNALAGIVPFSCDSPGIQLTIDQQPIEIGIELTVDPISEALGFNITSISGPNGSALFSASDINFNCGLTGDVLNFVSSYLVGIFNSEINTLLTGELGKTLDKSLCMPQNYYSSEVCPASQAGVQSVAGIDQNGDKVCCAPGSACATASGGGAGCVVKPLGLVGTENPASFLATYGAPNAELQLEVFVGQNEQPDAGEPFVTQNGGGLRARVVTGVEALTPSTCVPAATPPPATGQADIDFDTEAKNAGITGVDGGPYMVGVALSGVFLNKAAYEAYSAGLLCLDINSYNESLLNTQLLTPVLPSLGYIAPDNAAYAVLRPQNPPTMTIGAGTITAGVDGGPPQIVDPLLNVSMKDLRIDLFAVVDQRPVRLFSISTDVEVPLALGVGADGESIEVLLGNLNNILVNLNATQSNILAENPTQLLKLIPLVLSLAGPSLANIAPFALPNLEGFSLTLDGIHGIVADADGGYEDIGIFADLGVSGASGAVIPAGVPPLATLTGNLEPELADVMPGGTLKSWPTALVTVTPGGEHGLPTESSWSIDDGMWSVWVRGQQLGITSPNFLLQGSHTILLRTRPLGSRGKGWTQTLTFVADYTPPSVSLGLDETGRFTLSATDNITPANLIEWSVSSAGGAFGAWAVGTPDPNALAAQGDFVLQARDQAGNVTLVKSDPSAVVGGEAEGGGPGGPVAPAAPSARGGGCSSAPGSSLDLALLALGAALLFRRRKR